MEGLPTAKWSIVGGPYEYRTSPDGAYIDVGWQYDLERNGETRTIRVELAGGRPADFQLPTECRKVVATRGAAAVADVLDRAEPPARILITTAGLIES
jgi:hypothetical protein